MDYYQGIVTEFLRANRATFVNTEYLIQLDEGKELGKNRHWYCDALTVNFETRTVYLCEVTYSKTLTALLGRLGAWATHWDLVCGAIRRDSKLSESWAFRPWAFIPAAASGLLENKLAASRKASESTMPKPRITLLESVAPWNYCTWDRADAENPGKAPESDHASAQVGVT